MSANITMDGDAIKVNGVEIASRFIARRDIKVWWEQRSTDVGRFGLVTAPEGYDLVDPERTYAPHLMPLYMPDGSPTNQALVGRTAHGKFTPYGDAVNVGKMTPDRWEAMNKGDRYTHSAAFEIVTPEDIVNTFDHMATEAIDSEVYIETMGFLGPNGKDGFFFSVPLENWDPATAAELGTEVKEHFWVVATPKGNVFTGNGQTIIVCQNTAWLAVAGATRRHRIEHRPGALNRLAQGMRNIYTLAMSNRIEAQAAAKALAQRKMTLSEVEWIVEKFYPMDAKVDEELIGLVSLKDRQERIQKRLDYAQAQRDFMIAAFQDRELYSAAGITPETVGTAWAVNQIATFQTTYAPVGRKDTRAADEIKMREQVLPNGKRRSTAEAAFKELIALTDYKALQLA